MSIEKNKDVVRRLHDLWNTGELSKIPEIFHPDFTGHWPRSSRKPERRGLDEVRAGLMNTRTAFPDWHERVEDMIDLSPIGYDIPWAVHACLFAYGVGLLDNAQLEPLARACIEEKRDEFMLVIAPLVVVGGTGSPTNPLAVF